MDHLTFGAPATNNAVNPPKVEEVKAGWTGRTGVRYAAAMGEAALRLEATWEELTQQVQSPFANLIPVDEQLQPLFPGGGLRRGSTVTVIGSTSVALALVAKATQSGMWCAAVGMPGLGAVAAADLGIDLSRFPIVPDPGLDWSSTIAALVDGFDMILMRASESLTPSLTRRLEARMRQKGTALVLVASTAGAWMHTDAVIRQVGADIEGLGNGYGYLTARRVQVVAEGRGASARPRKAQVQVA